MPNLHFFDRSQEYSVIERKLPHWVQLGVVSFITFRTHDSMPKTVLVKWREQRADWLRTKQINPYADNWQAVLAEQDRDLQTEFYQTFSKKWHSELDACHGECALKNRALAKCVASSLSHADGDKYRLSDFIIMPNHIHLLCTFPNEDGLLAQCKSWKHFTAREINQAMGRTGRFWQQDGFDHLVRSEEQFKYFQKYIKENPRKAGLTSEDTLHYSATE